MTNAEIRELTHRLSRDCYRGRVICAFTLCATGNQTLFSSESVVSHLTDILLSSLKKQNCQAHVYLFMPDHCHLIIEGESDESDLWKCIVDFKQRGGYWFSKNKVSGRWQKDFYDHIVRDGKIEKHVMYVLSNPVRKNMAEEWKKYPYKGSTIYNFDDWD